MAREGLFGSEVFLLAYVVCLLFVLVTADFHFILDTTNRRETERFGENNDNFMDEERVADIPQMYQHCTFSFSAK